MGGPNFEDKAYWKLGSAGSYNPCNYPEMKKVVVAIKAGEKISLRKVNLKSKVVWILTNSQHRNALGRGIKAPDSIWVW